MQNVNDLKKEVLDCELCTKCGTCMGICPTGAIAFVEDEIAIDCSKCIQCGKCWASCPGKSFSMEQWSMKLFGRHYDPYDILGSFQSVWIAKAKEEKIYSGAASGGVVTQLCVDLLNSGAVDGVVAVRAKRNTPCEFEPFIAKTGEEIIQVAQSKYVLIPVNQIIKEIRESHKKVAFVGLPCQIQGMRKALENDTQLKQSIVVMISLFCGFNMEKAATDYLIKQSGIAKKHISMLNYRHKREGETGFYVKAKTGRDYFLNKHGYTFLNLIYSPKRCWKCFDYSGEFADISVGDAWDCIGGGSRVIVRTDVGNDIWEHSLNRGTLEAKPSEREAILKTQKMIVRYKKVNIGIRKKLMRTFPEYDTKLPTVRGKAKAEGYLIYMILTFFKTKPGLFVRKHLPFKLLTKISAGIKGKEIH